jgi:hypothetical protein
MSQTRTRSQPGITVTIELDQEAPTELVSCTHFDSNSISISREYYRLNYSTFDFSISSLTSETLLVSGSKNVSFAGNNNEVIVYTPDATKNWKKKAFEHYRFNRG